MVNRRTFLRSTATGTAAFVFAGLLPGLRAIAQPLPRRKSLAEMDLDHPDLVTYREFVRLMRDPALNSQPVSWVSFANVHGTSLGFNRCPHSNWYFLPWHRAYLRMYEAAARELTGNQDFALPYWDWTTDRVIPESFAAAEFDGEPNPLFVEGRRLVLGEAMSTEGLGPQSMEEIYDEKSFEAFGSAPPLVGQTGLEAMWITARGTKGPLEVGPHDLVHGRVGGFMSRATSPQDPVFLMHHCNVDRIWAVWNSLGRVNSSNPLWLDMRFVDHFIAPDGTMYTDVVRDLLEVAPLGYTYGLGVGASDPDYPGRTLYFNHVLAGGDELERLGFSRMLGAPTYSATAQRALDVALVPPEGSPFARSLERSVEGFRSERLLREGSPEPQVYAIVRDLDPNTPDTTELRVFVNCDYLSQDTPISDPHYVATIGFFGAFEGHRSSALVNLTPALRRLSDDGVLKTDEVVVQLLPVRLETEIPAGSVEAGEVELVII